MYLLITYLVTHTRSQNGISFFQISIHVPVTKPTKKFNVELLLKKVFV